MAADRSNDQHVRSASNHTYRDQSAIPASTLSEFNKYTLKSTHYKSSHGGSIHSSNTSNTLKHKVKLTVANSTNRVKVNQTRKQAVICSHLCASQSSAINHTKCGVRPSTARGQPQPWIQQKDHWTGNEYLPHSFLQFGGGTPLQLTLFFCSLLLG